LSESTKKPGQTQPRIIRHTFAREQIDADAAKVVHRLTRHGHETYLVGGCVRDLLAGMQPKDFDVATAATPGQVKKLFRNCWLIGRRFRLAHVVFGRERKVIEVSTFRARPVTLDDPRLGEQDLLIRDDNVFGEPWEDARRRDFTLNALFYDVGRRRIIDYVGGHRDLRDGLVRSIGEPGIRFREDPVRMLRACKYAAKLSFRIEPKSEAAIAEYKDEIGRASPSRLTEELYKILGNGSARPTLCHMLRHGLLAGLSPSMARFLERPRQTWGWNGDRDGPAWDHLRALDAEVREGWVPSRAVQLAAVVVPMARPHAERAAAGGAIHRREATRNSVDLVLTALALNFRIPKRDAERIRLIATAQERMRDDRGGRRVSPGRIAGRDYFDDAVSFLRLECLATGQGWECYARWRAHAPDRLRRRLPAAPVALPPEITEPPRRKRRRRRPRRRKRGKRGASSPGS